MDLVDWQSSFASAGSSVTLGGVVGVEEWAFGRRCGCRLQRRQRRAKAKMGGVEGAARCASSSR
jgi:hypothetical protein